MASSGLKEVIEHLRRVALATGEAAPTDRALLEAYLLRRDEAAFAALVRRHGAMVYGACRRILPGGHDADDAFQNTFIVLARKAHAIDRPELLANWLHGVACRTAHKARVSLARRHFREQPLTAMHEPAAIDPDSVYDLRGVLDRELNRLPEKYRGPLVLCELEGRSRRQAAEALGLPEGTVSSRLSRGRQLLAGLLSRRGRILSAAALATSLAQLRAEAAPSSLLLGSIARAGLAAASARADLSLGTLTEGVIHVMATPKLKSVLAILMGLALLTATIWPRPGVAEPPDHAPAQAVVPASPEPAAPRGPSVIVLWMAGGPSQLDTFDLKPDEVNGGPFKEIATSVKEIRISEHLPKLARHMDRMVLVRSLSHQEGNHGRGTHQMLTGYAPLPGINYPSLGSVLAKELGSDQAGAPDHVALGPIPFGPGPGYLGSRYGPVTVTRGPAGLQLPDIEAFRTIAKGRAEAWRKAMAEAIDLSGEKAALRDAYGKTAFGENCLVARRLVERRVPAIQITLGGWDTHQNNFKLVEKLSGTLDAGWSALIKDLKDRKLLDTTLIVWMGEFGRTPRINGGQGRDHYPEAFTVVLAGGGIKGGQVIGQTNADGIGIAARPVSVPEFMATIYQAVGVDANKRHKANDDGVMVPIVDGNAKALKDVLRSKTASPCYNDRESSRRAQISATPAGLSGR
jgi:RNA polymerase sigma factor (sigma-70 family)